jgi:hypothetical protein
MFSTGRESAVQHEEEKKLAGLHQVVMNDGRIRSGCSERGDTAYAQKRKCHFHLLVGQC